MKPLPSLFVETVQTNFPNEAENLLLALEQQAPVSIRLNPLRPNQPFGESLQQVAWCPEGFYLPERPLFITDPLFHAGCYYVQEASSMFLNHVLKEVYREREYPTFALDACASPGGKSTLIASFLNGNGFLLSNEVVRNRVNPLKENLTKWGYINTAVSNNTTAELSNLTEQFDFILVDAPCSGEGMFRKEEVAITDWSAETVEMCAIRQKEILIDLASALAVDGVLVYSTCTFNLKENEETVSYLLANGFEQVRIAVPFEGVERGINDIGFRFFPHKIKGEGFYMAVLKKVAHHEAPHQGQDLRRRKVKIESKTTAEGIDFQEVGELQKIGDNIFHAPWLMDASARWIFEHLNISWVGGMLGETTKYGFVPAQAAANNGLLDSLFPAIELTETEAIDYLRKLSVFNTSTVSKGFARVCYKGINLGWCKVAGNRLNNLYPKELRILNY